MPVRLSTGLDNNNQRGINFGSPSAGTDAANKDYVDSAVQGLSDLKDPVRAVSTGNVVLASGLVNGTVIDGVTLATGDRVLLKNQTAPAENGIYVVVVSGAASRSSDADGVGEVTRGLATTVLEGTTKGTGTPTANPVTYILTTANPVVLGTTALTFGPIGSSASVYTGGAGLTLSGNDFAVGQGTGIIVDADSVRIDPAVVTRKIAANNVAATATTVTHNFGSYDVSVDVFSTTGSRQDEFPDVTRPDINNVTVTFASAPAAGAYRIVVQG